jgi:choline dehydrogenase-like flavoprotein
MHPSDFKVKTLDGVADDWPIDYWALEPFFEENDRMMGVSGLAGGSRCPPHQPSRPCRRIRSGKDRHALCAALNKLGWHWWPSDTTVATTDYEGRATLHQSRPLHAGLRAGRQGLDRHHLLAAWRFAPGSSCKHAHCRVREILTNEHGMASGVVYYDKDGVEQFQPAEVVIIACNGVGTPRLLLNSVSGKFPNGLANSSGPGRQEPDAASLCRRSTAS